MSDHLPSTRIVVPCYNEARRLSVAEFRDYAAASGAERFLFVNDGSTDATRHVLEQLCEAVPDRFDVLHLEQNRGKAEAVRLGILAALEETPDLVGFWDADLATPLSAIRQFQAVFAAQPQVEIVMGARVRLLGRRVERHAARHYLGRVFATAVSLLLGMPVYDTQCGAKLFRVTDRTRALFSQPFLARWIFDVELLARFVKLMPPEVPGVCDDLIREFPLESWQDVPGSKLRARDFARALVDFARIAGAYRSKRQR